MDLRKVKKLIELVEESGIAELEVSSGDESVRIAMQRPGTAQVVPAPASPPRSSPTAAGGTPITAPMAGTFYRAPTPDSEPYADVGARVAVGDILCIIESMKMMHEIRADAGGQLAEVCVGNGQPVSTGDVLFRLS